MTEYTGLTGKGRDISDAGVISPCNDPCIWHVLAENISWPTDITRTPGLQRISPKPMDKNDTVRVSSGSRGDSVGCEVCWDNITHSAVMAPLPSDRMIGPVDCAADILAL